MPSTPIHTYISTRIKNSISPRRCTKQTQSVATQWVSLPFVPGRVLSEFDRRARVNKAPRQHLSSRTGERLYIKRFDFRFLRLCRSVIQRGTGARQEGGRRPVSLTIGRSKYVRLANKTTGRAEITESAPGDETTWWVSVASAPPRYLALFFSPPIYYPTRGPGLMRPKIWTSSPPRCPPGTARCPPISTLRPAVAESAFKILGPPQRERESEREAIFTLMCCMSNDKKVHFPLSVARSPLKCL